MKKILSTVFAIFVALYFISCGEDSTSANNKSDDEMSSSSSTIKTTTKKKSSSSVTQRKPASSSSVRKTSSSSAAKVSSSSVKKTSSSSAAKVSSSSVKKTSSSSAAKVSSSSVKKASSASAESCPSPKDGSIAYCCGDGSKYLNPNIKYGEMTDERDGKKYKTIKIGNQTWMAQNLNFETANTYCYYDDPESCKLYGRLYSYDAAIDNEGLYTNNAVDCGTTRECTEEFDDDFNITLECTCTNPIYPMQGVCPKGWHLPTSDEWKTLLTFVGGSSVEKTAKALKSTKCWSGDNPNYNGNDEYGFTVLPGGEKNCLNTGSVEWDYTYAQALVGYWTSTLTDIHGLDAIYGNAVEIPITTDTDAYDSLFTTEVKQNTALYIRCVKN